MPAGYMGKMLMIDLSRGTLKDEVLDEKVYRMYIGGYGLGARILFSRQRAGVDPLGVDGYLGFLTGPVTGTPLLGGSRYTVVGKSPLTGGWGDANSGGDFGPNLKFAGYDAVFFTGIAPGPVYLFINNGEAELRDAAHLWGKDTYQTEDMLKSELGKAVEIACIGPAGEKVALISAVVNNKGRAAARSGLGAVMGSKKLKAVAVKGNIKVPLADEKLAAVLRKKHLSSMTGHVTMLRDFGTPGITVDCAKSGDTPTKNWSGTATIDLPDYELLSGDNVIARQAKKYACWHCAIGCGGHMKEGTGEYQYNAGVHKPEYETIGMFGINCLNTNVESIIKCNDICNRYGLDTISAGATIAMTIECYEKGLITTKDTDGLEMTWGNHQSIVAMTEKMARREGFGHVIADGVKAAAARIGRGADRFAMHIQGQELPAHDPRHGIQWGICYRLDATPARHTQGGEGPHPPGVMPKYSRKAVVGRGQPHKRGVDFSHFSDSAGMCMFVLGGLSHANDFIDAMNAITGWGLTRAEVQKTGERITNLRQAFNIREGLNPLRFQIPGRVTGNPPQKKGPLAGLTVDEKTLNREYLTAMDWDPVTARPSREKLLELGLDDVAGVLYP